MPNTHSRVLESRSREDAKGICEQSDNQHHSTSTESKLAGVFDRPAEPPYPSDGQPDRQQSNIGSKEICDTNLGNDLEGSYPERRRPIITKQSVESAQLDSNRKTGKNPKGDYRLQLFFGKLISALQTIYAYFLVFGGIAAFILLPLAVLYKLLGF